MKYLIPATGWKGAIENWRNDFTAAISVALVALPLCLGIASTSGFEPIAGVISAIVGGVVATFFRSGHLSINGPGAGLIAAVLAAVVSLDGVQYALAAVIVAGVLQVLLGVLKLGKFAEIFPSSVINGILAAIGIIIISKELYYGLIGTQSANTKPLTAIWGLVYQVGSFNPFVICVFLVGITLLVFHSKINYKVFHLLPAPMWVLIITIPFVYLFNFFEPHTISWLGRDYEVAPHLLIDIPDDITNALIFPNFSKIATIEFWVAVLSIAVIGSITTLVCAKATDKLDPYKRKTDLDKDLIGVGAASIASAMLGGLPIMAVIVRSTVNVQNNAKTKYSNLYHAILLLLFILLFTPIIQLVPRAALSAILVFTGFQLAAPVIFKETYDRGIEQLFVLVFTLIITLLTDQLIGIIAGIGFTLIIHLLLARVRVGDFYQMTFKEPAILKNTGEKEYRLELKGIVNFMSLPHLNKQLSQVPTDSFLTIDGQAARLVDLTVLETLEDFGGVLHYQGGNLSLIGFEGHISSSEHAVALRSKYKNSSKPLTTRDKKIKANALAHGWLYQHTNDCANDCLEEFHFFASRPLEKRWNIITGSFPKEKSTWEISDVVFDEDALLATEVYNTTVEVVRLPYKIPKFVVEKEDFWKEIFNKGKGAVGYEDIDFKLFPDFSNKFVIEGEDEAAIRYFFDNEIIEFLETHEMYHIESNGIALLIFRYFRFAHSDEMTKMVDFSKELVEKIQDRVVVL